VRPMFNHGAEGDGVYDPFLGSGTTLIAAQQSRRHCFGVELDPRYVDMIVDRWQRFTGGKATLAGDGRSFEEIVAERAD